MASETRTSGRHADGKVEPSDKIEAHSIFPSKERATELRRSDEFELLKQHRLSSQKSSPH